MKKSVLRMLTAAAAAAALTILSASAAFAAQNFSYADLKGLEFSFSSGVGAWETMLGIMPDGTFFSVSPMHCSAAIMMFLLLGKTKTVEAGVC